MEMRNIEKLIENNEDYIIEDGLISEIREESESLRNITEAMLRGIDIEDIIKKKYEKEIEDKYIVEGFESLSIPVAKLVCSGYGRYIVNYTHKTGINHSVDGFKTAKELKDYANWVIESFNEQYDAIEGKIEEMKKIEERLTKEERAEKYRCQKEAEINIYKNIFDFEGKKKYCEEARELETINSMIEGLAKVHSLVKHIYDAL